MNHPTLAELEAALPTLQASPREGGRVEMIVRRPGKREREVLIEGELDVDRGLVGDCWCKGVKPPTSVKQRQAQLTLMNSRAIALIAQTPDRWPLAGDQLYVDLDLSLDHLPPGARLTVGSALIEISELPHTGCGSFEERFGVDARRFVNTGIGRQLNLRGVNAMIVQSGVVRVGDPIVRTISIPSS